MGPMMELEKRVSGDWIDVREAAADQYRLNTLLKIPAERLADLVSFIRLCVEEGLLEYKGVVLRPVFVVLEQTRYQNLRPEELASHEAPLEGLLLVTLLQRMICSGAIPLPTNKEAEPITTADLSVNQVIADIKERIKHEAKFQQHPAVKNIFMQVGIYQQEKGKMAKLLPMIREEKRETFKQNFQNTFQQIFDSIKNNYADILRQEQEQQLALDTQAELMHRLELKSLVPLLDDQAKAVSRIRSTLAFAAEDKYKTREILAGLHRDRREIMSKVDRERGVYEKFCAGITNPPDNCPHKISSRFRDLLIRTLERLSRSEE